MSNQDIYNTLPPGLDPRNLRQLALQVVNRDPSAIPGGIQRIEPQQPPQQQQAAADQTADQAQDQTPEDPATDASPDLPPGQTEEERWKERTAPPDVSPTINPRTGYVVPSQMRRPWEPYVPVSARGPGGDGGWGTPGWAVNAFGGNPDMQYGPFMPMPFEAYGIMRGAGAQVAQYGAPSYGQHYGQMSMLATMIGPYLDAITGGKFTQGYLKARMGNLQLQREEMLLQAQQGLMIHQKFLEGANEIFGRAMYGGYKSDLEAQNAMEDYLNKTGHGNLIGMLHTRGMKGVQDYLAWEDQKYRDTLAGYSSLKRATGPSDTERDAQWHGGGGDTRTAAPTLPGPLDAQGKPIAPAAQAAPGLYATQNATDAALAKKYGFTDAKDMDAAHQLLNGQDPFGKGGGPSDKLMTEIQAAAGDLRQGINAAAAGKDTQSDKLDAITAIDPTMGQKLRSMLTYDADPKENKNLIPLAQQISGGNYQEGNYANVQRYSNVNTDEGRSVRRVGTLSSSAPHALDAINKMRENETMTGRAFESIWNGDFKGVDDRYVQVYNAMRPIVLESVALESGTGRPAVSTQHDMMKHFFTTQSPRQMRSLLVNEARNAYGTAVQMNSTYRQLVQDPTAMAPGMFRYGMQDLNAIAHMNSTTGELPPGTPESIKYAGKTVKPSLPPLKTYSREDIDFYKRAYQELPKNDPRRDAILKALEDVF